MNEKLKFNRILHKRMFYALFVVMLPFFALSASAQGKKVLTGTVKDAGNLPLIEVSVVEKGTSNGALTNNDGKFTITLIGENPVIQVIYTGFDTKEITVGNSTNVDVVLNSEVSSLDEVVVIGYGTQRKADVTSAVASVKSESFNKGAVLDAGQLVQGKVAGLQISLPTGDPTATTSVMLRGSTTLKGSTDPLILVDGVPGSFQTVAPEDIESIDVLKDGSATAIYGTRGTNGVIIITTKGGRRDQPTTIDYNGYISISNMLRKPDFMDAADLRKRWEEGYSVSGANDKDYGATTNWLDEISRTGISHVHNLTFRGGGKQTSLLANLAYEDRQGTIKKSDTENLRTRLEMTHRMFDDKLTTTISMIANERKSFTDYNTGLYENVYRQACIQNPTQHIYDDKGNYIERPVYFYDNPVSLLNERDAEFRNRNVRFTGTMEYKPIESLSLKAMYTRKGQSQINGTYLTRKHPTTTEGGQNGNANRYTHDNRSNLIELVASWNKKFGKHSLSAIAGYNYEDNVYENFSTSNRNFPTDAYSYNKIESGLSLKEGVDGTGAWSYKRKDLLVGLFARATYNYDDRYLLMVSLRREGSSKFGKDNKWGSFPGISAGWRLNQESFMKEIKWLDNLKIRAGFGVTGTNIYDPYQSLESMNYEKYFPYNGRWIFSLVPSRNPNKNLKWEKKYEYNVGFDFDLFGGRIGGAIDLYLRDTKDALWDYQVAVPPFQYEYITANVGEIRNKGLEVLINAVPVRTEDFEWNTNISYSTNSNKLVSISNDQFKMSVDYLYDGHTGEPIQQSTHINKVGRPIGDFYGLKSVGLTSDGKWAVERLKKDADGNVTERYYDYAANANDGDKQVLGNGVPKHYLNWNNQIRYKNIDLSISMRGAFGFSILNFQKMYYGNPGIQYNVLNSAFDQLPVVDLATGKATGESSTIKDSQRYVSEYIEKGSYWKIDNVTLGYTFKQIKSKYIRNLRVYASCLNLATITGYSGIDPEIRSTGLSPGTDSRDKYPTVRSFTFGINVTF